MSNQTATRNAIWGVALGLLMNLGLLVFSDVTLKGYWLVQLAVTEGGILLFLMAIDSTLKTAPIAGDFNTSLRIKTAIRNAMWSFALGLLMSLGPRAYESFMYNREFGGSWLVELAVTEGGLLLFLIAIHSKLKTDSIAVDFNAALGIPASPVTPTGRSTTARAPTERPFAHPNTFSSITAATRIAIAGVALGILMRAAFHTINFDSAMDVYWIVHVALSRGGVLLFLMAIHSKQKD